MKEVNLKTTLDKSDVITLRPGITRFYKIFQIQYCFKQFDSFNLF